MNEYKEYIEFLADHWILTSILATALVGYLLVELLYKTNLKTISVQQMVSLINHENALVLDIRAREAFVKGHIVGSLNIPKNELGLGQISIEKQKSKVGARVSANDTDHDQSGDANINQQLGKYMNKPLVVVCSTGRDSADVVKQLTEHGFGHAAQLIGGIDSWIASGLPLAR